MNRAIALQPHIKVCSRVIKDTHGRHFRVSVALIEHYGTFRVQPISIEQISQASSVDYAPKVALPGNVSASIRNDARIISPYTNFFDFYKNLDFITSQPTRGPDQV